MKRIIALVLSLLFAVFICGCSAQETVSREAVIVNLPADETVNGYRIKPKEPTVSSEVEEIVSQATDSSNQIQYCANTNSKKFHLPDCSSAKNTKEENKLFLSDRNELIELGYEPCKRCKP